MTNQESELVIQLRDEVVFLRSQLDEVQTIEKG